MNSTSKIFFWNNLLLKILSCPKADKISINVCEARIFIFLNAKNCSVYGVAEVFD